ncbi:hypothetical protein GGH95_003165, partial [Coemansia sp. RSA 1836]
MSPYDGCAFPLVRTLSIDVFGLDGASSTDYDSQSGDDDDGYSTKMHTVYPPDTAANIAAFVRRLKEMMPAARDVIMTSTNTGNLLQRSAKHMMDLARRLFDLAEKRTTIDYSRCEIAYYVDLAPISDIVNIRCFIEDVTDPILALVRRCAQTLQTLDICGKSASARSGFIQDPDSGAYVEYPQLYTLAINTFATYVMSPRPVFNGAVPFPGLRRLRIDDDYPFDDDVAFRGNSATLESLRLALQPATVAMLKNAISLIKSLALLSDLYTAAPTFDELGQGINMAELPDYVRSTYAPVGQQFRCWQFGYKEEIAYEELATFMLLLALVCPSFDYVALSKDHREPFMEVMKRMITEPG